MKSCNHLNRTITNGFEVCVECGLVVRDKCHFECAEYSLNTTDSCPSIKAISTINVNPDRLQYWGYKDFPDNIIRTRVEAVYRDNEFDFKLSLIFEDLVYYTKKILNKHKKREVDDVLKFLMTFSSTTEIYSKQKVKRRKIMGISYFQFYAENKAVINVLKSKLHRIWLPNIPEIVFFSAKLSIEDIRIKKALIAYAIRKSGYTQEFNMFLKKNKMTNATALYMFNKIKKIKLTPS